MKTYIIDTPYYSVIIAANDKEDAITQYNNECDTQETLQTIRVYEITRNSPILISYEV